MRNRLQEIAALIDTKECDQAKEELIKFVGEAKQSTSKLWNQVHRFRNPKINRLDCFYEVSIAIYDAFKRARSSIRNLIDVAQKLGLLTDLDEHLNRWSQEDNPKEIQGYINNARTKVNAMIKDAA